MIKRPTVFVTRCVPPNGMEMLRSECDLRAWTKDETIPRGELLQRIKGADGLLCHPSEKIDQEVLDAAGCKSNGASVTPTCFLCKTRRRQVTLYCLAKSLPVKLKMIKRPTVFVTRCIPPNGTEMLRSECDVRVWPKDEIIPREELLKGIKGADGILCHSFEKIDQEVLDAAGPQLKVIGTMSVGLEHIDLALCKSRNIQLGYTPDVLTNATAEMTLGLLLATSRRLKEGFAATTDGGWGTWNNGLYLAGKEITGSTVGIVGLGRIGLAVAKRLQPFGVEKFLYSGNSEKSWASEVAAQFVPFENLLQNSDFVIACCSMNPQNKGLFNKDAFSKMKNSAIFINTSRGVLVNQDDLYKALSSNQILAAGLDVTTPEPLPHDNPLHTLKNCVITPHLGSATTVTRSKMADLVCRNILAGLKGQPLPRPVPL